MLTCIGCGSRSSVMRDTCRGCGSRGTFTMDDPPRAGAARRDVRVVAAARSGPVRLSDVRASDLVRRPTGSGELDALIAGGVVVPSTWLLAGAPGSGKSTWALGAAVHVGGERGAGYVSAEMEPELLREYAERAGVDASRVLVWAGDDLADVETWVKRQKGKAPGAWVIDSMARAACGGASGTVVAQGDVARAAVRLARLSRAWVCLIGHATKEGETGGPEGAAHDVDGVAWMRPGSMRLTKLRGSSRPMPVEVSLPWANATGSAA